MRKESYHHGALKEELVRNGLFLIQTEGMKEFTMRRVARLCQVSQTAAYKHFENKEELLAAIKNVIAEEFRVYLAESWKEMEGIEAIRAIGKAYVIYLLENPVACELLFKGDRYIQIHFEHGAFEFEEGSAFAPFYEVAESYLKSLAVEEPVRGYKILQMWCEVHGFAELIANHILCTKEEVDDMVMKMFQAVNVF